LFFFLFFFFLKITAVCFFFLLSFLSPPQPHACTQSTQSPNPLFRYSTGYGGQNQATPDFLPGAQPGSRTSGQGHRIPSSLDRNQFMQFGHPSQQSTSHGVDFGRAERHGLGHFPARSPSPSREGWGGSSWGGSSGSGPSDRSGRERRPPQWSYYGSSGTGGFLRLGRTQAQQGDFYRQGWRGQQANHDPASLGADRLQSHSSSFIPSVVQPHPNPGFIQGLSQPHLPPGFNRSMPLPQHLFGFGRPSPQSATFAMPERNQAHVSGGFGTEGPQPPQGSGFGIGIPRLHDFEPRRRRDQFPNLDLHQHTYHMYDPAEINQDNSVSVHPFHVGM